MSSSRGPLSLTRARLLIVVAAVLWSTSGALTKILTRETVLGLHTPDVSPLQIAFFRCFFASLAFLPLLRRRDLSFQSGMLAMMASFGLMNATFISAMALGTAANAIFLQYTAPMWMYLASRWFLGEPANQRNFVTLVIGLIGIACIVLGGWQEAQLLVVAIALTSGLTYAFVIIGLRYYREHSPLVLTLLNHAFGAIVLVPFLWDRPMPTTGQLILLFFYGTVQLAMPYWLMARGLARVSPQEAGTITLLEPILNPVWAYAISGELPTAWTAVGGAFILGALAWRYWPRRAEPELAA